MNIIINYWYIIVAIIAVTVLGIVAVKRFLSTPTSKQIEQIKAWLLWAVTQAERDLGSGTGKLKLSLVYGLFIEKFSWIARFLPFYKFEEYVDAALVEMKKLLSDNKAVADIVLSKDGE